MTEEEVVFIPTFELDMCVRDGAGNPTGKRKSIQTHDTNVLAEFFWKNSLPPLRRKRRKPNNKKRKNLKRKNKDGAPVSKGT